MYGNAHLLSRFFVRGALLALVCALGVSRSHAVTALFATHTASSNGSSSFAQGRVEITEILHVNAQGQTLSMPQVFVKWKAVSKFEGPNPFPTTSMVAQIFFKVNGTAVHSSPSTPGGGGSSTSGSFIATAQLDPATNKYYVTIGYDKTNGGTVVSQVTEKCFVDEVYWVTIKAQNDSDLQVSYNVYQNGKVIDTFGAGPGQSVTKKIRTDSQEPVTVGEIKPEMVYDFRTGMATKVGSGSETIVGTDDSGQQFIPQPGNGGPTQTRTTTGDSGQSAGNTGNVWDQNTTTKALTEDVYKQGVDGIIKAIKADSGSGGGGGSDTPLDLTPITSRQDTQTAKLEDIKTNTKKSSDLADRMDDILDDVEDGASSKVTSDNASTRGNSAGVSASSAANEYAEDAQDAAADAMTGLGITTPVAPGTPATPESGVITLDIGNGRTVTIPKNPFSTSGPFSGMLGTVAAFIKKLIGWGVVAAFMIWCMRRIQEMIEAPFHVAPFGHGIADNLNSIRIAGFGGGWGYVARLAALAVVVPILFTIPLAATTAVTTGLPLGEIKTIFAEGPGSLAAGGMLGQAIALSDHVIPWITLMAAPIWYFTVQFVIFPSKFFWLVFMKVVPL